MASLHNPRHEQFAQLVASGKSSPEAYVAAGYAEKAAYTCGPRLLKTPSVRARVDELRSLSAQSLATAVAITATWITAQLQEVIQLAKEKERYSAAITALIALGKNIGMFVERSEQKIEVRRQVDYSVFTDEQLEQLLALLKHHDQAVAAKRAQAALPAPSQVVDVKPVAVAEPEATSDLVDEGENEEAQAMAPAGEIALPAGSGPIGFTSGVERTAGDADNKPVVSDASKHAVEVDWL